MTETKKMKGKKHNATILIVDDDPKTRKLLSKFLSQSHNSVITAGSAEEAFALINREPPDLILLDILLPDVNGFDIARRLKMKPKTRDIPFIFLTVKTEPEDKVKGFKLGAVDYLTKPIDLDEAAARINTHLTILKLQFSLKGKNLRLQQEIAEHKRTEEALKVSENQFRHLAEFNPGPIVVHSEGLVVYVNKAAVKTLRGTDPGEFVGKPVLDFLHPDYRDIVLKRISQAQKDDKITETIEEKFIRGDGKVIDVEVTSIPTVFQGKPSMQVIFQDISERVAAENKIKASLREKEVLLKEIHHRVKNNLQVINSLLSLQSRRIDDKQTAAVFDELKNRIYSIALVHEKLYESKDLSNIDFGAYTRILVSHIHKTFPTSLSTVKLEINASSIFLQVNKAIPCALIINELVTNALKYAFQNGQKGEIIIEIKTNEQGKLTLTVADNGVGLPEDLDIDKPKALGLQIISALVRQLHGTLQVDKQNGTAFIIEFQK